MSVEVQALIQNILTHDPNQRPTLHEIVDHDFFTNGTVPPHIPRTAHDRAPDFRHISRTASKFNFDRLRRNVLLDEDEQPINVPSASMGLNASRMSSATGNASALSSSVALAQQEREFQRAVQPSSPISALLGAARQPLVKGAASNISGREREQPLIRKLQAAQKEGRSPGRALAEGRSSSLAMSAYAPVRTPAGDLQDIEEEKEVETKEEAFVRRRELEAQKARIVAQMTSEPSTNAMRHAAEVDDMENIPPQPKRSASDKVRREPVKDLRSSSQVPAKVHGFDSVANTLSVAFEAKAKGKLFRDPSKCSSLAIGKFVYMCLQEWTRTCLMPESSSYHGWTTATNMAWVMPLQTAPLAFTSTTAHL